MNTQKITYIYILLVLVFFTASFLSGCASNTNAPQTATDPTLVWALSLGGTDEDAAMAVTHTSDGGSVVVGATNSNDGDAIGKLMTITDLWIIKLTKDGVIEWQKRLGGSGGDFAMAVKQTSDLGFIVAGFSNSKDGDLIAMDQNGEEDMWIMKLDEKGNTKWRTTHGGSRRDGATAVVETHDGNYVIAGGASSNDQDITSAHGNEDFWIIKLNHNGVFVWEKSFGGTGDDEPHSIEETSDNGFIVSGSNTSVDGNVTGHHGEAIFPDAWIVKIDADGNLQWQRSFGGSSLDVAAGASQTPDGGYFVVGGSYSIDGDLHSTAKEVTGIQGWALKLGKGGAIEWQKSLGNSLLPQSMVHSRDGGFILGGMNRSGPHGGKDMWIAKLNQSADIQWQKTFGGSQVDEARGVDELPDGSVVAAGMTTSNDGDIKSNHGLQDVFVVKIKP